MDLSQTLLHSLRIFLLTSIGFGYVPTEITEDRNILSELVLNKIGLKLSTC